MGPLIHKANWLHKCRGYGRIVGGSADLCSLLFFAPVLFFGPQLTVRFKHGCVSNAVVFFFFFFWSLRDSFSFLSFPWILKVFTHSPPPPPSSLWPSPPFFFFYAIHSFSFVFFFKLDTGAPYFYPPPNLPGLRSCLLFFSPFFSLFPFFLA